MAMTWDTSAVEARVRAGAMRAVAFGASAVQAEGTRMILSPPKTGRFYKLRGGGLHQASAPGEAPANKYGLLAASSSVNIDDSSLDVVQGIVNWGAEYAMDLEVGTAKIAPRPYARPSLDATAPAFLEAMVNEIKGAV